MLIFTEIRLILILAGMLFLPGMALLIVSGTWRHWPGLQRVVVAIGLSVAFYPVLFYGMRFLWPQMTLGPYKMGGLLLLWAGITVWGVWRHKGFTGSWRGAGNVAVLAAVGVLLLTVASRAWVAHVRPYPAWSDSLHHTLITQLTAQNGRLPFTLEPYFPNVLDMYHLGLDAISGTAQMLTGAAAHTALLWTAQLLNAYCGLGIYLVLARYGGRNETEKQIGAVVGLAIAGLFSVHPALYVNWGRFTQL